MLTSYAQNFEDVILWQALGHVERGLSTSTSARGIPSRISMSLAFYEKGWRGLHVEPTEPFSAARLREARRDEDVLQAAVGPGDSPTTFYAIKETGLSTCDGAMAERHAGNGYRVEQITGSQRAVARGPGSGPRSRGPLAEDRRRGHGKRSHPRLAALQRASLACGCRGGGPLRQRCRLPRVGTHIAGLGYEFVYFNGLDPLLSELRPSRTETTLRAQVAEYLRRLCARRP